MSKPKDEAKDKHLSEKELDKMSGSQSLNDAERMAREQAGRELAADEMAKLSGGAGRTPDPRIDIPGEIFGPPKKD
jgi:hypothetical protein